MCMHASWMDSKFCAVCNGIRRNEPLEFFRKPEIDSRWRPNLSDSREMRLAESDMYPKIDTIWGREQRDGARKEFERLAGWIHLE